MPHCRENTKMYLILLIVDAIYKFDIIDIRCKCKVWGCDGSGEESEFESTSSMPTMCNFIWQLWYLKDSVVADYI